MLYSLFFESLSQGLPFDAIHIIQNNLFYVSWQQKITLNILSSIVFEANRSVAGRFAGSVMICRAIAPLPPPC